MTVIWYPKTLTRDTRASCIVRMNGTVLNNMPHDTAEAIVRGRTRRYITSGERPHYPVPAIPIDVLYRAQGDTLVTRTHERDVIHYRFYGGKR